MANFRCLSNVGLNFPIRVPGVVRHGAIIAQARSKQDDASLRSHPAIAQRELLRQFYLSSNAAEQAEVVRASSEYLDTDTR